MSQSILKNVILSHLQGLQDDLRHYAMTTHGAMYQGTIEETAQALIEAFNDNDSPQRGSYLISNLYQALVKLEKSYS